MPAWPPRHQKREMNRPALALAVVAATVFAGAAVGAEIPLIGFLVFGHPREPTACADALRRSLLALGLQEERDYRFAIQYARSREQSLHDAARALAFANPRLLVSAGEARRRRASRFLRLA